MNPGALEGTRLKTKTNWSSRGRLFCVLRFMRMPYGDRRWRRDTRRMDKIKCPVISMTENNEGRCELCFFIFILFFNKGLSSVVHVSYLSFYIFLNSGTQLMFLNIAD